MFPLQGLLFALLPAVESFGAFTALACIIMLCYGGGFGTMPAFAADRFGAENVGSIYGLMLTAWSFAGVLGPMLIAALRQQTGQYGDALYVIAGLDVRQHDHSGAARESGTCRDHVNTASREDELIGDGMAMWYGVSSTDMMVL